MPSTWNATAGNGLITGAALRDGATAFGAWTITTSIPTELNTTIMTKSDLVTYTDIPTGNFPLSGYASNQCVTKDAISGVF